MTIVHAYRSVITRRRITLSIQTGNDDPHGCLLLRSAVGRGQGAFEYSIVAFLDLGYADTALARLRSLPVILDAVFGRLPLRQNYTTFLARYLDTAHPKRSTNSAQNLQALAQSDGSRSFRLDVHDQVRFRR